MNESYPSIVWYLFPCMLLVPNEYEIMCLNLAHGGRIFSVLALALYLLKNKIYPWTGVVCVRCYNLCLLIKLWTKSAFQM